MAAIPQAFAPKVGKFLINLDRSPDRLTEFDDQARRQCLEYVRFSAVDGYSSIPDWLRSEFDPASGLTRGEIGCYASHLSVCRIVRDKAFDAAIVFEDDVEVDEDFEDLASAAIRGAPNGWDIIHFSTLFKRPAYAILALGQDRNLVRYSRLPANSACYAVSSAGASKLLRSGRRRLPIDMEFRYPWLRSLEVYGVHPPLAKQRSDISSTIDGPLTASASASVTRPRHRKPHLFSQARGLLYVIYRLGFGALASRLLGNSDGRWLSPSVDGH